MSKCNHMGYSEAAISGDAKSMLQEEGDSILE